MNVLFTCVEWKAGNAYPAVSLNYIWSSCDFILQYVLLEFMGYKVFFFSSLIYDLYIYVHSILHSDNQSQFTNFNHPYMGDFKKNEDFVWHRGWNFKLD